MISFSRLSKQTSDYVGKPQAFGAACTIIIIWAVVGPIFHYSDSWSLVINTITTIITFLMVFLLQHTQNRDSSALHAKLDELIRAIQEADNAVIGCEQAETS